ncbi:hypothetical protein K3495_g15241 [Podosphaera aphanis]|nr:hypothetical protein K3495_g15241 [Podosphaera aphanis]
MNIQPDALPGSAPPPCDGFVSYIGTEGVLNYVQEHANKNSYAVSTAAGSKANRKFIRCDKGGNPDKKGKNPSVHISKQRKSGSKKTGYPFSLFVTQGKNRLWSVKVEIDQHNHSADTDEAASPLNRIKRRTKNELQDIHDGFENSDQPKSILSKHNYHSKATLTSRDIYNLKAAWNAQKLEGNSKLMAPLKDLEKEGFYYRIKKEGEEDSDDEEIESSRTVSSTYILTHLYIAHPQSIEMYKNNHELLLLDCTYCKNRFSMPYLNFCGKTGNNSTLQICLAFLPDEKIPSYEALRTHARLLVAFAIPAPLTIVTDKEDALLNSLNRYFPSSTHLLCRWRVNKNIVKNTRDK